MNEIKTSLKKGQVLDSGFSILDVVDLSELKAIGIWAKHKKSGVEVFHVLNDDDENLFSFSFTTYPTDNTGLPHILEHSVLCGSERYPLKDAFIVLAQGSLQTFLNAMTFPDKTVYPASSTNEHDYFNLMSVYGDSVFRPLLPEWTFMQEGHRYEFAADADNPDGKLSITGVVYNEMKGAYSSQDSYAGLWSVKAILPDTPYAFESGGDPVEIPQLTYEDLKQFHKNRYAPANCRIFLAGNISTEKQLDFLNKEFFSTIDKGKACDEIHKVKKWKKPKTFNIPYPAGSDNKSTIFVSWLCCDATQVNESISLAALTEILLGHDGSPLTRVLIESGLGEDITPVSGLEGEIRETLFVAGLKGVKGDPQNMGEKIEALIMTELNRLAVEGIPPQEIEAALLAMEFSQREIRRSGGPFSLVWMRRSLRSWLHGSKPWESLLLKPMMEHIKNSLAENPKYFESLIQKYFLDNPHRALVILEPKEDFLKNQEEELSRKLAETEKNLSKEARGIILAKSKALEIIQSEPDTPETLAAIPHLSRKDLSVNKDIIHRQHENFKGLPAICHDLFTNGISYFDISFPVDILPPQDYCWLPFFSRAIVSVGLPGMDYGEVSSLLARTVGGLNSILHTGSSVPGVNPKLETAAGSFDLAGRDWLIFRLKCLDEKIPASLDLALRLIREADFSDHNRISDLVLEMKTEMASSLAPVGHVYASAMAGRRNSLSKMKEEIWMGLSQIEFAHKLVEYDIADIAKKLEYLREKITGAGLIANLTGNAYKAAGIEFGLRFGCFGPPVERSNTSAFAEIAGKKPAAEIYASPSLQIGFAAMTLTAAPFDTQQQLAEMVLAHKLNTGALWEGIRMKGGAYGALVNTDSLENSMSFATYRDPTPARSLEAINAILKNGSHGDFSEVELVKTIIGCYAKETRPRTSAENGLVDFYRFLYGIEDSYRQRKLERLVSTSTENISAAFSSLNSREVSGPIVITGIKNAEDAAKELGAEVKVLPA